MAYDVVVVGAGPGGLECARVLAEGGKSVLLIDRKEIIGPKVCAGGLTLENFGFGIPKHLLRGEFPVQYIHTPAGTSRVVFEKPVVSTISRHDLGQWQLSEAKKSGAEVMEGIAVTEIRDKSLIADGKEIFFGHLVGSDGAGSIVRRHLGIPVQNLIMAIQYIVPRRFDSMEWFFDDRLFSLGYGWIFPHGDYASIGCGCESRFMPTAKLRENFHAWLADRNIDVSGAKYEGHPISYDYRGHRFGNKFLVGDAGGFTSGLTGEGIYFALVSGHEVAKMILDEKYYPEDLHRLLAVKREQEKILNFLKPWGSFRNAWFSLFTYYLNVFFRHPIKLNEERPIEA
ncbi:MAG: FAD-dependent monooxygenase [Candidatus Aenigmarchaeota archaeon]|nr:FAD-dependent monooxygenase [Candidatus Aenigmarchaeota archaeon]